MWKSSKEGSTQAVHTRFHPPPPPPPLINPPTNNPDYANDLTIVVAGFIEVFAAEDDGTTSADRSALNDLTRYARTPDQVQRDLASGKETSVRGGTWGGAAAGSEYAVMGPGDAYGTYSFFTEVSQHEVRWWG